MSLQDEYLKQALRHAPDREIAPAASARKAVLDYAHQSLKSRKNAFYGGQGWWNSWHVESWQWAGTGSVFATLLILVVFWHEQPRDIVWKEAGSDQVATAEMAADATFAEALTKPGAIDQASENNRLGRADKAGVTLHKAAPEERRVDSGNVDAEASIAVPLPLPETPIGKTILADAESFSGEAGPVARKAEAQLAAPAVAKGLDKPSLGVPETMTGNTLNGAKDNTQAADAVSAEAPPSSVLKEQVAALANGVQPEHKADRRLKQAEVAGADTGNSALAVSISKAGGEAIAHQDIKAGILRHLYLGEQVAAKNLQACVQSQPDSMPRVDSVTGYAVEFVSGCNVTDALSKEVAIYNQTMRAWHAKDGK